VPSVASATSSGSIKKRLRSDAGCTGPPRGAWKRCVRNVSLVNVEKIAKGLKTGLPELFRRV
jgi:hypothetical protein